MSTSSGVSSEGSESTSESPDTSGNATTTGTDSSGGGDSWRFELSDNFEAGFMIDGSADYDSLGTMLASLGDWNNDEIGEILLGHPLSIISGGEHSGAITLDTILAQWDGVSLTGDYRPRRIDTGNLNGDSRDDILIGAPQLEIMRPGGGITYLVWAPEDFMDLNVPNIHEQDGGVRITGPDHFLGLSVTMVGDINGDGMGDAAVWGGEDDTLVVHGGTSSMDLTQETLANEGAGFVVSGCQGSRILSTGDVNGDQLSDMLIMPQNQEKICVVFGKDDLLPVEYAAIESGTSGFIIDATGFFEIGDGLGIQGASRGDFDGDGFQDVVLSAPYAPSDRKLVILLGMGSWGASSFDELEAFGHLRRFSGDGDPGGFDSQGLSFVPDLNGDGRDELLVSNTLPETVALVFGSPGVETIDLRTVAETKVGVEFYSAEKISLGAALGGKHDVTGDDVVDLLIGAPTSSPNGVESAGRVYVVSGAALLSGLE